MKRDRVASLFESCEEVSVKHFAVLIFVALLACSSSDLTGSGGDAGAGGVGGSGAGGAGGSGAGGNGAGGHGAAAGHAGTGGGAGALARVVFVTSTAQSADFGGIEGADALCASQAAAAGLTGDFRAWLSTSDSSVADRLTQSAVPYVLVDGTRIADDWADLTDGSLQAVINLDATGASHRADVWTGTLPSGLAYTETDCDGFTNGGIGSALCGTTQSINSSWTANQVPTCDTRLRLFCFEQ